MNATFLERGTSEDGSVMAKVLLSGIGVSGYRSFSEDLQYSGALGGVTLLAGQNNAGKSNLLRFLARVLEPNKWGKFAKLDYPQIPDGSRRRCQLAVAQNINSIDFASVYPNLRPWSLDIVRKIVNHQSLHRLDDRNLIWFIFDYNETRFDLVKEQFIDVIKSVGGPEILRACQEMNVQHYVGGNLDAAMLNAATLLAPLSQVNKDLPRVVTIDAFRQIQPSVEGGGSDPDHTGVGLLHRLQQLQNPPAASYREDIERFGAINRFLQTILDDPNARLEVQHDVSTVNVHHDGRVLPLEHLGTGVHQVVILAVAATVLQDCVVCIEEPEVHLHPVYQRKLIRYLSTETSNQYLIATHSAHLLDYEAATVIHVRHNGLGTELSRARTPTELSDICADLGYRPSDLLQANAVIWVEGPSDRIYLQHWLAKADSKLIEGLHYSIMFYGGRLLSHLSTSDEVSDFIELRRLNRYSTIIIDSDKKTAQARLNLTKKRILDEYGKDSTHGFAWVTEGYTIENYVPASILDKAVSSVHPDAAPLSWQGERWENPLIVMGRRNQQIAVDKIRIARKVVEMWIDEPASSVHLRRKTEAAVAFIRRANGLATILK